MTSIYRLVAERRDRNQSIRRKRSTRNLNFFKESVEEIQLRRPIFSRTLTMRQRTVSDQPYQRESNPLPPQGIRKASNDIVLLNIKNQIREVEEKVDFLGKKMDELADIILSHKK
jgi:hypothetical protein